MPPASAICDSPSSSICEALTIDWMPEPHRRFTVSPPAACGAAPADCVVVEDSALGARAGIAAGCRVMGFCHESPAGVLAAHGAEPFADMAALPGC
jgi:hypothetical protein